MINHYNHHVYFRQPELIHFLTRILYPLTTIPLDEKDSWLHHLPETRRKQLYDGETLFTQFIQLNYEGI